MPTVVNSVGAFVIKELTGERRELTLVARGLPYRPFNLRTSQRVELSWYPGNPEATATVLGAKEEPSNIEGYWKDKYIGSEVPAADVSSGTVQGRVIFPITLDGIPIDSVRFAVQTVDDMVRQGQLMQVTWDEQTRHGHLVEFDKNWDNLHDLKWSMSFQWISRGEPVVPAVFTTSTSLSDTAGTLDTLNTDLQNAAGEPPSFPSSTNNQQAFWRALGNINLAVLAVKAAAKLVTMRAGQPFDGARRTSTLCTQIIGLCGNFNELLTSVPPGATNSVEPLDAQSFQQRLVAAANIRELLIKARKLQLAAIDRRAVYLKQVEKDLLAIYQAREGDDLRDVAELYYQSPFEWRQIMLFNELDTPLLYAGQVVLVPRRAQNAARRSA